jgi:hypothetical protein
LVMHLSYVPAAVWQLLLPTSPPASFLCNTNQPTYSEFSTARTCDIKAYFVLPHAGCSHRFCKGCLASYLKSRLQDKQLPAACPSAGCRRPVSQGDAALLLAGNPRLCNKFIEVRPRFRSNSGVF